MNVGQATVEAVVVPGELFVIEPKQVQHCRVEVPNSRRVHFGSPAEFVGGSVAGSALHARTHHPAGEAVGVVIASDRANLIRRHPAELRHPQNQRIFEQS